CKKPPNAVNSHRVPRPKGNRPTRYRIHATNQLFIATDTSSKTHATLVDFYSLTSAFQKIGRDCSWYQLAATPTSQTAHPIGQITRRTCGNRHTKLQPQRL